MPALWLTVFADMVGFGIVIPLLPFYAQRFGAAPDTVALLVSVFTFFQFLGAPVWGRLSDRLGRKPVLLLTLAGTVAGYVWLAFAGSLAALFLARAWGGAMAANMTVAQAYVADTTPERSRAGGMGRIGAAGGLGFVVGPALGGLLGGHGGAAADFRLPFLAAAALSALALVLAAWRLRETVPASRRAEARARRGGLAAPLAALARPGLRPLAVLAFLTPFVFAGIETIFALWSERALGWGPRPNGALFAFMGATAVVVQGVMVGPLARRWGERRLLLAGPALLAAGMALLPFADAAPAVAAAALLIVTGVCLNHPALSSLVSRHAGAAERGAVLGGVQAVAGAARFLGPAWSGHLFAAYGRDAPFFAAAGVMALMAALVLVLVPRRPAPALDGGRAGR